MQENLTSLSYIQLNLAAKINTNAELQKTIKSGFNLVTYRPIEL